MPKPRSKDPLLAATTSILLPVLKPFGFQRRSNREFVRIRQDLLHTISTWYSGWGGNDFFASYSAMPLAPPTDYAYVARGERLRDEVNRSDLWAGQTHDLADASMQRIAQHIRDRVLPFFASIETTEGFLALLQQRPDPDHHHDHFRAACCLVGLRRLDQAKERLTAAIRAYAHDGREWCAAYAARCDQMLKAIGDGTDSELLEAWKMETIGNLKLEKFR